MDDNSSSSSNNRETHSMPSSGLKPRDMNLQNKGVIINDMKDINFPRMKRKSEEGYFSDSGIEEHSVYSFGGIFIDESNQKITDNLVSLYTGTTANIVLVIKNHFYVSNIGDSMAVVQSWKGDSAEFGTQTGNFRGEE